MVTATLADLMAWEALPEETRALAQLVLFGGALEPEGYSLQAAYEAGWEAGQDAVDAEVTRHRYNRDDFNRWLSRRGGT